MAESRGRERWWTFGGLKANATLGSLLRKNGFTPLATDSLSISLASDRGTSSVAAILEQARRNELEAEDLEFFARDPAAIESLKFWFCLPPTLGESILQARWKDAEAVAAVLASPIAVVRGEAPEAQSDASRAPAAPREPAVGSVGKAEDMSNRSDLGHR
jgi:ATP-dependent Lhr-like helicase